MNFFKRLFHSNMTECPRCLGKGNVDLEDIIRLKKEAFWIPGKCAYCNGKGKVPPARIAKVDVGLEYLTTDLSSEERYRILSGKTDALERANDLKESIHEIVRDIEHLYYIQNKEPDEIADYFISERRGIGYTPEEKNELVRYIKKVIKSKLRN